jgi:hypothetical protein
MRIYENVTRAIIEEMERGPVPLLKARLDTNIL